MVVMTYWLLDLGLVILLFSLLKVLIIVMTFMVLANPMLLTCLKILCLMIKDTNKMLYKEINIKNSLKLLWWFSQNRRFKIDEKSYNDFIICFVTYALEKPIQMMSLCYRELVGKNKELDGKNTW